MHDSTINESQKSHREQTGLRFVLLENRVTWWSLIELGVKQLELGVKQSPATRTGQMH